MVEWLLGLPAIDTLLAVITMLALMWAFWDAKIVAVGYVPEQQPPPLNLDRNGMPLDYATYVWLLYRKVVEDESPARRAFLQGEFSDYLGASLKHAFLTTDQRILDMMAGRR